jgi:hypothetical protein
MGIVNNVVAAEMDHTVSGNAKDVMALENAPFVAVPVNPNRSNQKRRVKPKTHRTSY